MYRGWVILPDDEFGAKIVAECNLFLKGRSSDGLSYGVWAVLNGDDLDRWMEVRNSTLLPRRGQAMSENKQLREKAAKIIAEAHYKHEGIVTCWDDLSLVNRLSWQRAAKEILQAIEEDKKREQASEELLDEMDKHSL